MRLVIFGLLGLLLACLDGPPALAHAVLEATVPEDGAALAAAPASVLLRFNEPVVLIRAVVVDGEGRSLTRAADATAAGDEVRIALPPLSEGVYLVSYRVTSLDSHPVSGSILFSIGAAAPLPWPGPEAASAERERFWRAAYVLDQTLLFAAALGAGGMAFFLLFVGGLSGPVEARVWRAAGIALALAGVAAPLLLGLEGALLEAAPRNGLLDHAVWMAGAATSLGASLALELAGILVFAVALLRPAMPGRRVVAALGGLLLLAGFLATGHAAAVEPRWLFLPAVALHVLAVAFWIGSVAGLALLLAGCDARTAAPVLLRFSRCAVPCVTLLVLAGLVLAAIQVGSPRALVATGYGRLLLLKIAAVAGLLGLAAVNKWRFTPRLQAGDPAAHRGLRRFVGLELAVMLGVLLLTAILAQMSPPHAPTEATPLDAADASAGVHAAAQSGSYMAMLDVSPAVAGTNSLRLFLHDADGNPVDPAKIELRLAEPDQSIEPILRSPVRVGPGRYALEGPELAVAGNWRVRIEIRVGDFGMTEFEIAVPIRAK